jgi:hypothetical protein
MSINEPIHDSTSRNTSTSKNEGRMKVNVLEKRKILKKLINKYGNKCKKRSCN